jgi:hypothetical protein
MNEQEEKKEWQKPEIEDLDVKESEGKTFYLDVETWSTSGPAS